MQTSFTSMLITLAIVYGRPEKDATLDHHQKFYRKIDLLPNNLLKEEFSLKDGLQKPDEEALKLIEGEIKQVAEEEFKRIQFPTDPFGFFPLDKYHRYDEIVEFVKKLVEHHAHIAQLFKIGDTFEKRPIYGVKIGKPRTDGALKKGIFIDAGVHAREWIAPAACLCVMNAFVRDYNKNETIARLVDNLDWFFVPNANPDGYEYTWDKDRMWRKTTAPQYCNSTGCCYGVDLNRNWGFHWGESVEGKDPCSEMYPGASPFSEPETKSLSKWIYGLKNQLLSYITLHSYGQMWLIPYGYERNIYAPDFDELLSVAQNAGSSLEKINGRKYRIEASWSLYPASGTSDDWAKGVAGIKYSFTIELRPGEHTEDESKGFILSSDQIIPTGEELFAGLNSLGAKLLEEQQQ